MSGRTMVQPIGAPQVDAQPKILFLYTGNACRGQMAKGWALRLKPLEVEPPTRRG